MIQPDALAESLRQTSVVVERDGPLTWSRVDDWSSPGRVPTRGERGGGMVDAETDDRIDDRREDAAAARYKGELTQIAQRMSADAARLRAIMAICNPSPPKNLATRDMQQAQVAADGWCISCYRDDQFLEPIALRPAKAPAPSRPYYRDNCRWCGAFHSEHGVAPPVTLLRLHHKARPITEADVERALGKVSA